MFTYKGQVCIVDIEKGQSLWQVDRVLYKNKLLPFRGLGFLYFLLHRKRTVYGEYEFERGSTYFSILKKIVAAKRKKYKLTIPEGLESYSIINRLYDAPKLVGGINRFPEEGACFPSTYVYYKGAKRQEILNQMQSYMIKIKKSIAAENVNNVMVLASIIEKEADCDDEKPIIASVYTNRLNKNMLLQADPTVIYGLTKGLYNKRITLSDLKFNTPYNTYMSKGLPPKPICSPGLKSIEAALKPAQTDYVYFVATGNKGHWFSKDYQTHLKYVKKYREHIKK